MFRIELNDICKKHPFLYEVNDQYYAIGNGTFRECSLPMGIEYLRQYNDTIQKIGRDKIMAQDVTETSDLSELRHNYNRVLAYARVDQTKEERGNAKKRINCFLNGLNRCEKMVLLSQLEDYVYVFRLLNEKNI